MNKLPKIVGFSHLACAVMVACAALSTSLYAELSDPYFASSGSWQQKFADQWGLHRIGFLDPTKKKSAWNIETGESRQVIVAVIDSGLDFHHPDLDPASVWRNPNETANGLDDDGNGYVDDLIGWNFIDNKNNPWDLGGHGTHVAGVIAAKPNNDIGVAGVNWGVKIMPLKVMNFVGRGRMVTIAEAIHYAVTNGAKIINLSVGVEYQSSIQQDVVDYAVNKGVLIVVAAGNAGKDTAKFSPAGLKNVITVAASDPENKRAPFSNWGNAVDITAPGVDILSLRARRTDFALMAGVENYQAGDAYVGEQNEFYRASGTSFATPLVSGVASLLFANNPDLTVEQVKRMLLHSATDIDQPGVDRNTGYGLINANAALTADPKFFVEAGISGVQVVRQKNKTLVRVSGTADADRFSQAWLELGEGDNPKHWKKVSKNIKKAVRNGVLADIDAGELRSAKLWTIKVVSKHKNGRLRENRYQLKLG